MRIKINDYDTIETDRYKGMYQIKLGRVGKDDKFYQDFKVIRKQDGSEIKVPVTLTFKTDADFLSFVCVCENEVTGKNENTPF